MNPRHEVVASKLTIQNTPYMYAQLSHNMNYKLHISNAQLSRNMNYKLHISNLTKRGPLTYRLSPIPKTKSQY